MKRLWMLGLVLATVFGLAACGGSGGAAPLAVTIKAEDIKYDMVTINASVGQTVNITMVNSGALDHTLLIDDFGVKMTAKPGETVTASFTASKAGTFSYYCNVPGHKEAGMVGTLTVK